MLIVLITTPPVRPFPLWASQRNLNSLIEHAHIAYMIYQDSLNLLLTPGFVRILCKMYIFLSLVNQIYFSILMTHHSAASFFFFLL